MKKKNGYVIADLGIPLLTLVFVGIAIVSFSIYTTENKRINDLDRLGREYILRMESNGYLDDANKNTLMQELQAIGANNISIQGTMSEAPYGSKINLSISCNVDVETVKMDGLNVSREKEPIPYSDTWSSTSKH